MTELWVLELVLVLAESNQCWDRAIKMPGLT